MSRATYVAIAARLGKGSALAKPRPNCSACSASGAGSIDAGKAGVRPGLGVGEVLAGAARDILHEAGAVLDDRTRPQASAVHEYRKDMKRWRRCCGCSPRSSERRATACGGKRATSPASSRPHVTRAQGTLDALADLGKSESGLPAGTTKAPRDQQKRKPESTSIPAR